jgi:hypothetical protein
MNSLLLHLKLSSPLTKISVYNFTVLHTVVNLLLLPFLDFAHMLGLLISGKLKVPLSGMICLESFVEIPYNISISYGTR